MKKIISASLAFSMVCFLFSSCKKTEIDAIQKTSFLSSANNRVAFANSLKTHFPINPDALNRSSSSNANGTHFIAPFVSSEGNGIFDFDFSTFTLRVAYFTAELNGSDYYRENPDGTVSVHVNSNRALAEYAANAFDPTALYLFGTNAHFSASYTGPVVEDSYYDWDGNLVTYKYIAYWDNPGRVANFEGNGKVGVNGVAPFKDLSMKVLLTPDGQSQTGFTLK